MGWPSTVDLPKKLERLLPWLVAACFSVLYAKTLLPGLHHFGDTTKAQFLGRLLGTTHPTGYPLYILLTAPFSHLPLGTLAQRINAFSALCGVVALVGIYGVARALGVRPLLAAVSCALLGLSKVFWEQTVIAEVYSLNAAFLSFIFLALVRHGGKASELRWFLLACGLYSLSFGNHLTVVTLLPCFVLAALWGDRAAVFRPRAVGIIAASIALGALSYAYLFTRTPDNTLYLEYEIRTLRDLWRYVSGGDYQGKMFAFDAATVLSERLPRFLLQLFRDLGFAVLLAPVGMLLCKDRRSLALLGLAALGEFVWVLGYDIPDIEVYLIPVELVLVVFIGVALERGAGEGRALFSLRPLASAGLAVFFLAQLAWSHPPDHETSLLFEQKMDRQIERLGEGAVIVGAIHYSPRMALVHRLYAEGLSGQKRLHLAKGSPKEVARYLEGRRPLIDGYSKEPIPQGSRVFVTERAYREGWRAAGLRMQNRGEGLKELVLASNHSFAGEGRPGSLKRAPRRGIRAPRALFRFLPTRRRALRCARRVRPSSLRAP